MRFLWKSQLKRERGRLLPKSAPGKSAVTRKDRFVAHTRRSGTYALVLFLWLLFVGTVGYLILFSSYLTLGTWQVTGLEHIKQDSFRASVDQELSSKYLGLVSRSQFFLLQPKKLERFLQERYPLIRHVSVERIFPDTFTIAVEERAVLVLWCIEGSCAHIMEDGSVAPITDVYQEDENRSRTLTIRDESNQPLRFGVGVFDSHFVDIVLTLKQELKERLGLATKDTLTFSSRFANELRLQTETGWWVYVNTRMPIETSLDALQLLLEKEIPEERVDTLDYIDLRTENRIFYRYQDSGNNDDAEGKEEEVPVESKTKEKKKE